MGRSVKCASSREGSENKRNWETLVYLTTSIYICIKHYWSYNPKEISLFIIIFLIMKLTIN